MVVQMPCGSPLVGCRMQQHSGASENGRAANALRTQAAMRPQWSLHGAWNTSSDG